MNNIPPPDSLTGTHILVAAPCATQLLTIGHMLIESGAAVTLTRDGLIAIQAGRFDLALLDLDMPGRGALALCADLHSMSPRLRIVILTASDQPEIHASARAAGADLVLAKPLTSPKDLAAALRDDTPPPEIATFAHLLDIAGPQLADELIARFQDDLGTVKTRLTAALPTLDWINLRSASHVLIALSGTAGAQALEQASRNFNLAANDSDGTRIAKLSAPVLHGLDALIRFIAQIATDRLART